MFFTFGTICFTRETPKYKSEKAGREFILLDGKFTSGKLSVKSIPEDWHIEFTDERVFVGKNGVPFIHREEVYSMLIMASTHHLVEKKKKLNIFMKGIGINL